jgi:hypothetical protein
VCSRYDSSGPASLKTKLVTPALTVLSISFQRASSGSWNQVGSNIDGDNADSYAGCAVAMSDTGYRVAVGARGDNGGDFNGYGYAAVYDYGGSSWSQAVKYNGASSGVQSGTSVDLSPNGNVLGIGSPRWSNYQGYVTLAEYSGGSWNDLGDVVGGAGTGGHAGKGVAVTDSLKIGTY